MERDAEAVLTWTCEACGWSVDVPEVPIPAENAIRAARDYTRQR